MNKEELIQMSDTTDTPDISGVPLDNTDASNTDTPESPSADSSKNSDEEKSEGKETSESDGEAIVEPDDPVKVDSLVDVLPIILIVEDGNGLLDANSYVTIEFADRYCIERNKTEWLKLNLEEKKKLLILATDYVDQYFSWKGKKIKQLQALSFPRKELYDSDGYLVEGIPLNLKKAIVEAALLNQSATSLFITKNKDGNIKRKKVDTLEVEYFVSNSESESYTTIYESLNKLLAGLYNTDSEQATFNVGVVWADGLY